jgi:hypothetical protein
MVQSLILKKKLKRKELKQRLKISGSLGVGDYDLNEHHDWLKEQKQ